MCCWPGWQAKARNGSAWPGAGDSLRLALLRSPQVQKELKLTDRQKERLAELEAESKVSKKRVESTYGKGDKGKAKAKAGEPQTDEERIAREARESDLDGLERQADERLGATLKRTRASG